MILGVCDWLSGKINVEAKYLRIGFVLAVILAGTGVLLYLILFLVKILQKD